MGCLLKLWEFKLITGAVALKPCLCRHWQLWDSVEKGYGLRNQLVKGIKWKSLHHKSVLSAGKLKLFISACFNHKLLCTLKNKLHQWIFHTVMSLVTDRKTVEMFPALTWWHNVWCNLTCAAASSECISVALSLFGMVLEVVTDATWTHWPFKIGKLPRKEAVDIGMPKQLSVKLCMLWRPVVTTQPHPPVPAVILRISFGLCRED